MSTPTLREAAEKALVLADEYARAAAKTCVETLYGTSKSYTAECVKDEAACREALRAALAAPAAAPDGWRLVPVEPTEAMIEAARDVKRRRLLRAVEDAKAGRDPNPMGAAMACDEEWRAMHAAAPTAPAEPRVEPAPHPSTPIAALLQQYADECSDFSGPDGYAFALKIANRYAESGPDCQMRCVVHTLLNPPEPATLFSEREANSILTAEVEALRGLVAEWEKLRDPVTLHVSLLRGFPARLPREVFLHLAGDAGPKF